MHHMNVLSGDAFKSLVQDQLNAFMMILKLLETVLSVPQQR